MALLDLLRPPPRILVPEQMDQPGISPADHEYALQSLARLNRFTGSASVVAKPIWKIAEKLGQNGRPLRVLDIASGAGDILISVAKEAQKKGIAVEWYGCDISNTAIAYAQSKADEAGVKIKFLRRDVLNDPIDEHYDVVMSSLFLHHLNDEQGILLMRRMRELGDTVLIHDLVRSRHSYWMCKITCLIMTSSPIIRFDGPASVAGAYTISEVRSLADKAGLAGAKLAGRWPQKFLLQWDRA